MSIRAKLQKGALQYLEPGEQIQSIFLVKRPRVQYNDRAIVATDRRLLLLEVNNFGRPTGALDEVRRDTRLGPCRGFMQSIDCFGTSLAVNRRFFDDVLAADRAAGFYDDNTLETQIVRGASSSRSRLGLAAAALSVGFVLVIAFDLVVAAALGVAFSDIGWWQVVPNIATLPLALWAAKTAVVSDPSPLGAGWRWVIYIGVGLATLYVAFFTLPMEALGLVCLLLFRPTPASVANPDIGRDRPSDHGWQ